MEKCCPKQMALEITEGLKSHDNSVKIVAMRKSIRLTLHGGSLPQLYSTLIRYILPSEDYTVQKLLLLHLQIIDKIDFDGTELTLNLRNNLDIENEYVHGVTLRFLCRLNDVQIINSLVKFVRKNLRHKHSFVKGNAILACMSMYGLPQLRDGLLADLPQRVERCLSTEQDPTIIRKLFLTLLKCAQDRAFIYLFTHVDTHSVSDWGELLQTAVFDVVTDKQIGEAKETKARTQSQVDNSINFIRSKSKGEMEKSCTKQTADNITEWLKRDDKSAKICAMRESIRLLLNGGSLPKLFSTLVRYILPSEDPTVQKLLLLFLQIKDKICSDGTDLTMNLCRNLESKNKYVRGVTLRFLCCLNEVQIIEPLIKFISSNLSHKHPFVRRNAILALMSIYRLPQLRDRILADALERIKEILSAEQDPSVKRNAFLMLLNCAQDCAIDYLFTHVDTHSVSDWGELLQMAVFDVVPDKQIGEAKEIKASVQSLVDKHMDIILKSRRRINLCILSCTS